MNGKSLIYAVDDELSIRELYKYALNNAGFDAVCFSSGDELYTAVRSKLPDLIILDIMLDGEDGYEILVALRKNELTKSIPVIMVSAKGEELDKVKGLDLGADDYISKPFGILELVARINAKLRAAGERKKTVLSYKDISIDETRHCISLKGEPLTLTLKEYELLKLLVVNAESVIERDKLLDCVWGENYGETRTLDMHIAQLRKVISASDAEIQTVRGVGYVLK